MTMPDTEQLRYPIGKFRRGVDVTPELRQGWIEDIASAPALLRGAIAGLSDAQLDTPYRPDGWTVRQVAHHLADSHMNSFVRFKLALTEDRPTIKPYDENRWVELDDGRIPDAGLSLALLEGLHARWVVLLRSLKEEQWARAFVHPESGETRLDTNLGIYAWHGRHHIAHITSLRERMGW